MRPETRYLFLGAVVLIIIGLVLYFIPGDEPHTLVALNKLKIATGFTVLALVFLFAFSVLVYIANGRIDLSGLLSETNDSKGASMSRFQLLIFTLVIALSLFLVVASKMAFPASIPPEILTLLGISGTTYAVSKGIQMSATQPPARPQAPLPPLPPGRSACLTGAPPQSRPSRLSVQPISLAQLPLLPP